MISNKHEGVKYPCCQCKYVANAANELKRHIESEHEGLKETCSN